MVQQTPIGFVRGVRRATTPTHSELEQVRLTPQRTPPPSIAGCRAQQPTNLTVARRKAHPHRVHKLNKREGAEKNSLLLDTDGRLPGPLGRPVRSSSPWSPVSVVPVGALPSSTQRARRSSRHHHRHSPSREQGASGPEILPTEEPDDPPRSLLLVAEAAPTATAAMAATAATASPHNSRAREMGRPRECVPETFDLIGYQHCSSYPLDSNILFLFPTFCQEAASLLFFLSRCEFGVLSTHEARFPSRFERTASFSPSYHLVPWFLPSSPLPYC